MVAAAWEWAARELLHQILHWLQQEVRSARAVWKPWETGVSCPEVSCPDVCPAVCPEVSKNGELCGGDEILVWLGAVVLWLSLLVIITGVCVASSIRRQHVATPIGSSRSPPSRRGGGVVEHA